MRSMELLKDEIIECLYRRGMGLGADEIAVCREGIGAIESIVASLSQPDGVLPDTTATEVRLQAMAQLVADASDIARPDEQNDLTICAID